MTETSGKKRAREEISESKDRFDQSAAFPSSRPKRARTENWRSGDLTDDQQLVHQTQSGVGAGESPRRPANEFDELRVRAICGVPIQQRQRLDLRVVLGIDNDHVIKHIRARQLQIMGRFPNLTRTIIPSKELRLTLLVIGGNKDVIDIVKLCCALDSARNAVQDVVRSRSYIELEQLDPAIGTESTNAVRLNVDDRGKRVLRTMIQILRKFIEAAGIPISSDDAAHPHVTIARTGMHEKAFMNVQLGWLPDWYRSMGSQCITSLQVRVGQEVLYEVTFNAPPPQHQHAPPETCMLFEKASTAGGTGAGSSSSSLRFSTASGDCGGSPGGARGEAASTAEVAAGAIDLTDS